MRFLNWESGQNLEIGLKNGKNGLKRLRLRMRAEKPKNWLRHLVEQIFLHKTFFYLTVSKIARPFQRINPCGYRVKINVFEMSRKSKQKSGFS